MTVSDEPSCPDHRCALPWEHDGRCVCAACGATKRRRVDLWGHGWRWHAEDGKHLDHEAMEEWPVEARLAVADYLTNAPEQGEYPWPDHCDGLSGGVMGALWDAGYQVVARDAGTVSAGEGAL